MHLENYVLGILPTGSPHALARNSTNAPARIGAGEFLDALQVVNDTDRVNLGDADATDRGAT